MTVEQEIDTRAKLESWLVRYEEAREAEKQARDTKDGIGKALKQWLEDNPGEVLYDGEHGLQAYLQERDAPGRDCDLNALWDNDQALFRQLVRNGCLKVDEAAIKRAGGNVGGIERYLAPKARTVSLQVGRVK
jgi:hypothetical protein